VGGFASGAARSPPGLGGEIGAGKAGEGLIVGARGPVASTMSSAIDQTGTRKAGLAATTLAALGIVFGDIGTSPLYAFRECFAGPHGAPLGTENLVGAASLIVWSLILVVSLKYLFVILRLDNRGEGGILALSTLIRSAAKNATARQSQMILLLGLGGAALIYADGMLTPAISVLSAVEGLAVSAPAVANWTVPVTIGILLALFSIQRHGTHLVGRLFGPVVLLWFGVLAVLGIRMILAHPQVLWAMSPSAGLLFMVREWGHAFPLLAAVFLAVTGGEALYADLGHFGLRPIRLGWFAVVFPGLVLNYLGQAALLVTDPEAIRSPFFLMAPEVLRFPLTVLATAAAIIASQALISGAFSLTTQAVQLGCIPRMRILHTSAESIGQVYVPLVNWLLAISCILLVFSFGSSSGLAGAYGIAIALTMTITSLLFFFAARAAWGWSRAWATAATVGFLVIDGAFLTANAAKIIHGGWLPITVAAILVSLMLTWLWGRRRLLARMMQNSLPVEDLIADLSKGNIHRVSGTAIYMSGRSTSVPNSLLHNLKHNQVLHERVLLLHIETLDQPHANRHEALVHLPLGEGLHRVTLSFGFADTPNVPAALKARLPEEISFSPGKGTYFLGRENYGMPKNAGMLDRIRLALFAAMARNASPATAYFHLPPGRVVELGAQLTL
jgi:KUP system potassium uptake protein